MKSTVSIFIPSFKTVVAIVVVNLLIFGSIGGTIFYFEHLSNLDTSQGPVPVHGAEMIRYNDDTYWLGTEFSDEYVGGEDNPFYAEQTRTFFIGVKSGDRMTNIPFFKSRLIDDPKIHGNFSQIDVSLELVSDDFIIVLIKDVAYQVGNETQENRYLRENYLGVVKLNDDRSELDSFHLYNVNSSQYQVNQIIAYGDDVLVHLLPYYEWVFDYLNDSTTFDALSISSTLDDELLELTDKSSDLGFYQHPIRQKGELLNISTGTAPRFDLISVLEEEHGPDRGLYYIEMLKDTEVELVDSQGVVHILGELPDYLNLHLFRVEGETNRSVLFNTPDYLAYDPSTNTSQYWDLSTSGGIGPGDINMVEVGDGQIFVRYLGPNHQELYNNTDLNPLTPGFNNEEYRRWWQNNNLQYFVITPVSPT